jgi:hypothetical protein
MQVGRGNRNHPWRHRVARMRGNAHLEELLELHLPRLCLSGFYSLGLCLDFHIGVIPEECGESGRGGGGGADKRPHLGEAKGSTRTRPQNTSKGPTN